MTDEWWESLYDTAALDIRDAYIQQLMQEFRYLSEKENNTQGTSDTFAPGDEAAGAN